jgi:hypothetical protein
MRNDLFRYRIVASDSGDHWEIRFSFVGYVSALAISGILLFSCSRYTDQGNASACVYLSMMTQL